MSPRAQRAVAAVQTWPRRGWRFVTAPVTDKPDYDLSLTRILAIYFALLLGHAIEEHHPVSGTILAGILATYAVAFGKSTFTFFLTRYRMKSEAADVTQRVTIDATQRLITERRDSERGIEPAP